MINALDHNILLFFTTEDLNLSIANLTLLWKLSSLQQDSVCITSSHLHPNLLFASRIETYLNEDPGESLLQRLDKWQTE